MFMAPSAPSAGAEVETEETITEGEYEDEPV